MSNNERIELVRDLVRLAECGHPDNMDADNYSPGADYFDTLAATVLEAFDHGQLVKGDERGNGGEYRSDVMRELAQEAIDPGTHNRWMIFADLAAYEEDDIDAEHAGESMMDRCLYAIVEIGYRAVQNYMEELDAE
jgi:hypothetical protein